jgi:membrane-bound serine protease (ClpP class)
MPQAQEPSQRTVVVLDIDGVIGPALADYVVRGLGRAKERGAQAVMLRLDTPGGLDTSMRVIVRAVMASPLPVLAYVSPSGARAASAGTFILYASHIAAMAPGTNLGAATPIAIGGGGPPMPGGRDGRDGRNGQREDPAAGKEPSRAPRPGEEPAPAPGGEKEPSQVPARSRGEPASASEAKSINDAVAYIRSLAELRGRDADWAERAVREAASLSANAALDRNVVDIVAANADDLLKQAHGREVKVGDATMTLDTAGLRQEALLPDWRTRFLAVITNPNVALILMMIGVYGLLFELMSPGAIFPGTVGAISLLLGLYALAVLPVNHAAAGLAVLGMALLIAEAFVPSFGILGLGGLAAFAIGVALLMDTEGVPGFEIYWPLIGGLTLACLGLGLLVARLAMRSFKHQVRTGEEAMLGARAQVMDWTGLSGHVFLHGERWNAVASQPLVAGQRVRVVSLEGLTLGVAADNGGPGEIQS